MPPFFDDDQIRDALRIEAEPVLNRLAENPNLRDRTLSRFELDEPPPYASSTESDEEGLAFHPALGLGSGSIYQEFEALIDSPLNKDEQHDLASGLQNYSRAYDAGQRFRNEARRERALLDRFYFSQDSSLEAKKFLGKRAGEQRLDVIVRRNIRRRWQKLGIWNPHWGIPGQVNEQPSDDTSKWKWRWQHGNSAAKWHIGDGSAALNLQHPVTRAVQMRNGLHREEPNPVPPRSHLEEDASATQAESFIISRPWFMFVVELGEERRRFNRIPGKNTRFHTDPVGKPVIEWWKQRGDWREDWEVPGWKNPVPMWKWGHESPSPEPEDLTPLNTMDMEFSPSEADALESIRPQTPPYQQRSYDPDYKPTRFEPGSIFASFFDTSQSLAPSNPVEEHQDRPVEPTQAAAGLLSNQRRQDEVDRVQPRRSARIAATKLNQPESRTPKATAAIVHTPIRGKGYVTGRPVPARPPPMEAPNRRRRPRISNRSKPLAASKVPALSRIKGKRANIINVEIVAAATVATAREGSMTGSPVAQKRGRGRPRKDRG